MERAAGWGGDRFQEGLPWLRCPFEPTARRRDDPIGRADLQIRFCSPGPGDAIVGWLAVLAAVLVVAALVAGWSLWKATRFFQHEAHPFDARIFRAGTNRVRRCLTLQDRRLSMVTCTVLRSTTLVHIEHLLLSVAGVRLQCSFPSHRSRGSSFPAS